MRVGRICVSIWAWRRVGSGGPAGFVSGQPLADICASPGLTARDGLADHLDGPVVRPHLTAARIDRSYFGRDELTYPVLAVPHCDARSKV